MNFDAYVAFGYSRKCLALNLPRLGSGVRIPSPAPLIQRSQALQNGPAEPFPLGTSPPRSAIRPPNEVQRRCQKIDRQDAHGLGAAPLPGSMVQTGGMMAGSGAACSVRQT